MLKEIDARTAPHQPAPTSVDIPLSAESKRVLQHAGEEAARMGAYIGTEHLLLGLLCESESLAAVILRSTGLRLEEVREEAHLLLQAEKSRTGPENAFHRLVNFLGALHDAGATYHVSALRRDAIRATYHVSTFDREVIRVEVASPEERWVAAFFADGRVAVDVFAPSGALVFVHDETSLAQLVARLGPSRPPDPGLD